MGLIIIPKLLLLLLFTTITGGEDGATLRRADVKGDPKVVLKNSIAYHFIRNVRASELELFVTRKIDASSMLTGLDQIKNVRDRVLVLCKKIKASEATASVATTPPPVKVNKEPESLFKFFHTDEAISATEAGAKCKALGLQLPELYTANDRFELVELMRKNRISAAHAGIRWDSEMALYRFVATGQIAWTGLHQDEVYFYDGQQKILYPKPWKELLSRAEFKFFYTRDGLLATYREHTIWSQKYFTHRDFRDWNFDVDEFSTNGLICQTRWNGSDLPLRAAPPPWKHKKPTVVSEAITPLPKRLKRNTGKVIITGVTRVPSPLEELCHSVADHLTETFERSQFRLVNSLRQVDISITSQVDEKELAKRSLFNLATRHVRAATNETEERTRSPRSLANVVFKSGLKSAWALMGFIDKVQTRRRLNKVESILDKNTKDISELTREMDGHTVVINKLTLVTKDLSNRLDSLQDKVQDLEHKVGTLGAELRIQQLLQLLDSLIGRADQALSFAFGTLENIIQCALIGQASAFLLPTDKLEDIQKEITKVSSAVLDTTYENMKATIVSDPLEVASITCFVNLYAKSRKTRELVRLVPIPWFQGVQSMAPALDYTLVLLDQEASVYTVIDPTEEPGCLTDQCIISNPEVSTAALACGIPQFYNRHLSACINEDIPSNGMFLKRLLHDGIVYSVRSESDMQIFCKSQSVKKNQKITGSGLVTLPPGCTLTLTDPSGSVTKIQSSPVTQLLMTQAIELIPNGPSQIFQKTSGVQTNVTTTLVRLLNQQILDLDRKLAVTTYEVEHHNLYVIVLGSLLGIVSLICILIALLLYRYSKRFRRKVRQVAEDVSTGLSEAKRTFVTFEQMAAHRARGDDEAAVLVPPRPVLGKEPLLTPPIVRAPRPPRLTKHDSLKSIMGRLNDLEMQILMIPDESTSSTDGYTQPTAPLEANMGASEFYVGPDSKAPPIPPKPLSVFKARPYTAPPPEWQ